jgi:enamine deaminase RidA (YjgF/YER057c/UK114 family)
MPSFRRLVTSGSPLEPEIGFSRAVRAGPYVYVAGTAPIAPGGSTAAPGDVYAQSVRCLDIAEQALHEAGAALADVVRTRVMLTDIRHWKQAARAHAERFAQVRPVTTFIEVSRFVDPQWRRQHLIHRASRGHRLRASQLTPLPSLRPRRPMAPRPGRSRRAAAGMLSQNSTGRSQTQR